MIQEGSIHEVSMTVTEKDTAEALADSIGGEFPAVFATSKMIALMELSAAQLMVPLLSDGELSVGVGVNITHMAATPVGEKVTAKASYMGQEERLFKFKVEVYDRGGVVGKGVHTRAIVEVARIMAGTKKRLG
jgi:predicted thioesterase